MDEQTSEYYNESERDDKRKTDCSVCFEMVGFSLFLKLCRIVVEGGEKSEEGDKWQL